MKKLTLSLLVLLAAALLPISAQAAPGDQPAWSDLADHLRGLWSLVLDVPQSLWRGGHAMVDPVGQNAIEGGQPVAESLSHDGGEIQTIVADGNAMIDPVGFTAPIPTDPESPLVLPDGGEN